MMYAYQIIPLIDIQFKIMINVLKKKKKTTVKKNTSPLGSDIVWQFKNGLPEAMSIEG